MTRNPQSDVIWQEVRNESCRLCSLHESAQNICLLGDGPVPADGMVIGEAPGFREDEVQIPFSGKSGLLLRKALKSIGLDPRTLYITNTVACRPPGNRTPSRSEVKICSSNYLPQQLGLVKPKVVLLLGNTALSFALGRKGQITKLEGHPFTKDGIVYVPCRHPSSVVRSEGTDGYKFYLKQFTDNLTIFRNKLFPTGDTYEFIESEEVPKFEDGPVYIDIEANGLSPFKEDSKIWCLSAGQEPENVITHRIQPEKTPAYIDFLKKHPIMAHRTTYEGIFLRHHYGITPKVYFDTKLAAYLMDENEPSGLKHQAVKFLGVEPWDDEIDFRDPDWEVMLPYNNKDTVYSLRLKNEIQVPFLKNNPKVAKLMKYLLLPAIEVFIEVICSGFHIDMQQAATKRQSCAANLTKLNDIIDEIAGYSINPGSPKQMCNLLYNELHLKCPVKTKKGSNSSSEAALIRLSGKHEIIEHLLEWRKWKKYDSTYLTPWMRKGPILHANYGFTNTDTGRLNSTMVKDKRGEKKAGATIHQCPRDIFVRNLICPRGFSPFEQPVTKITPEDWCIIAADLSQAELRLVADAANEPEMIRIFNADEDIHTATALTLLQPGQEIQEEDRKKAKAVNFGFVYGMWAKKFIIYAKEKFSLNLSLAQGEKYREAFFDTYSGLISWHNRVEYFVSNRGYIDSKFGRKRHLPFAKYDSGVEEWIRREQVRQAINSPIQSAASDLTLFIAALMLSLSLPWSFKVDKTKAFMVGSAHDSLLFECKRDYAKQLREGIQYTVQKLPLTKYFGFEFKVPIKMDVDAYATHWKGKKLEWPN